MSLLKAKWEKIAIANYLVHPSVLKPFIPEGTELDTWNGKCIISLVGVLSEYTRIYGIRVPFHFTFEEVNLHFYVKRQEDDISKKGIVHLKEIVPKYLIKLIGNSMYNEEFETMPMNHHIVENGKSIMVKYSWCLEDTWQKIKVITETETEKIEPGSEMEFVTEHFYGYSKQGDNKTFEYLMTHPKWLHYPVMKYDINVDFKILAGPDFEFMNFMQPHSVMLLEGSEISLENKTVLN